MVSAGYEAESDMICKVVFVSLINADPQHCLYYVITVNIYVAITPNIPYGGITAPWRFRILFRSGDPPIS